MDGKLLHGPEEKTYLMLNKPKGYVTTVSDPEGRQTVMDLVKARGSKGRSERPTLSDAWIMARKACC